MAGHEQNDHHGRIAGHLSSLNGGGGRFVFDTQPKDAAASNFTGDEDHFLSDTQTATVNVADLNGEQEEGLQQPDDHDQSADLLLPATAPLIEARAVIKTRRLEVERECQKLAKQLPVWPWVEAINGFGALGLAQITGECGDLNNYANPAKVWKRMGLAVINGKAQRRVKGAEALEQGYSPNRRSISWNIGTSMIKKQNPYRDLYLDRKVTEQAKVPDGTKMLWHRRAQRYMEKRVLRDLWRAWTAQA